MEVVAVTWPCALVERRALGIAVKKMLVEVAVKPEVVAFTAECPHLGCAVNLAEDGKTFLCPCHTSAFDFTGKALNDVPPRGMDTLDVELTPGSDPEVLVKFGRFRTQEKEKTPLA